MMMNRHALRVCIAGIVVAAMGFGCAPASPQTSATSTSISNPQPLSLAGLSPKDAAHKINLVGSNVLKMHQAFTGTGLSLAAGLGYGAAADRDVVIQQFAPSQLAAVEWKTTTQVPSPTAKDPSHKTQMQYVGAVKSGNLRDSHVLYPPVYWTAQNVDAFGSGILWLSQDVYEDLAKTHISTMKYGVEDGQMLEFASSTPALRAQIVDLQAQIKNVIDRKDVFLTTSTSSERSLIVNGTTSTVAVIVATNWFGQITVLDNPQNPLVLSVKMGTPGGIDFGGLFDYNITALQDLMQ